MTSRDDRQAGRMTSHDDRQAGKMTSRGDRWAGRMTDERSRKKNKIEMIDESSYETMTSSVNDIFP